MSNYLNSELIHLSAEDISRPELVFQRLFEYSSLSDLRYSLDEIKKWLFGNDFPHAENALQLENTEYFFERLQQLIEAAFVFRHQ